MEGTTDNFMDDRQNIHQSHNANTTSTTPTTATPDIGSVLTPSPSYPHPTENIILGDEGEEEGESATVGGVTNASHTPPPSTHILSWIASLSASMPLAFIATSPQARVISEMLGTREGAQLPGIEVRLRRLGEEGLPHGAQEHEQLIAEEMTENEGSTVDYTRRDNSFSFIRRLLHVRDVRVFHFDDGRENMLRNLTWWLQRDAGVRLPSTSEETDKEEETLTASEQASAISRTSFLPFSLNMHGNLPLEFRDDVYRYMMSLYINVRGEHCSLYNEVFENCKHLRHITIYKSETLTDLSPVAGACELRSLTLIEHPVEDLEWLITSCLGLRKLSLQSCQKIKQLRKLFRLRSLYSVELYRCESLTRVDGLKYVTELICCENPQVMSVPQHQGPMQLQKLDITHSGELGDFMPRAYNSSAEAFFSNLVSLSLTSDVIDSADLNVLRFASKLVYLDLSGFAGDGAIHDIKWLSGCMELQELRLRLLWKVDVESLCTLRSLLCLTVLDLKWCTTCCDMIWLFDYPGHYTTSVPDVFPALERLLLAGRLPPDWLLLGYLPKLRVLRLGDAPGGRDGTPIQEDLEAPQQSQPPTAPSFAPQHLIGEQSFVHLRELTISRLHGSRDAHAMTLASTTPTTTAGKNASVASVFNSTAFTHAAALSTLHIDWDVTGASVATHNDMAWLSAQATQPSLPTGWEQVRTNLTHLSLKGCPRNAKLTALHHLGSVTALEVEQSLIEDIAFVRSMTKMSSLSLCNCELLRDVSPIASLVALKKLNLSGTAVRSFDWMRTWGTPRDTPSGDNDCSEEKNYILVELCVESCTQVNDWSPLGCLKALRVLDASRSSANGIHQWIQDCAELEEVHLSECTGITDFSSIGSLCMLRHLDLSATAVTSIEWIDHCTALTSVCLSGCDGLPRTEKGRVALLPNIHFISSDDE